MMSLDDSTKPPQPLLWAPIDDYLDNIDTFSARASTIEAARRKVAEKIETHLTEPTGFYLEPSGSLDEIVSSLFQKARFHDEQAAARARILTDLAIVEATASYNEVLLGESDGRRFTVAPLVPGGERVGALLVLSKVPLNEAKKTYLDEVRRIVDTHFRRLLEAQALNQEIVTARARIGALQTPALQVAPYQVNPTTTLTREQYRLIQELARRNQIEIEAFQQQGKQFAPFQEALPSELLMTYFREVARLTRDTLAPLSRRSDTIYKLPDGRPLVDYLKTPAGKNFKTYLHYLNVGSAVNYLLPHGLLYTSTERPSIDEVTTGLTSNDSFTQHFQGHVVLNIAHLMNDCADARRAFVRTEENRNQQQLLRYAVDLLEFQQGIVLAQLIEQNRGRFSHGALERVRERLKPYATKPAFLLYALKDESGKFAVKNHFFPTIAQTLNLR